MASVSDHILLNQQPAGGLIFCVKGTRTVAVEFDLPDVVKSCDVCLEVAEGYYDKGVIDNPVRLTIRRSRASSVC